jgi:hypothetical protein
MERGVRQTVEATVYEGPGERPEGAYRSRAAYRSYASYGAPTPQAWYIASAKAPASLCSPDGPGWVPS